ncbi:MAG TPA: hypothetical protein VLL48_10690, partial [Longimicrobiales bacterium]|nr:hypothetical protein [Longimicrobiales bacterium]
PRSVGHDRAPLAVRMQGLSRRFGHHTVLRGVGLEGGGDLMGEVGLAAFEDRGVRRILPVGALLMGAGVLATVFRRWLPGEEATGTPPEGGEVVA